MEYSLLNVLILMALGLLLIVTLGVAYLTTAEWRDRRREQRDKKAMSKK
jgi:Tfp pilus assembly protein PilW